MNFKNVVDLNAVRVSLKNVTVRWSMVENLSLLHSSMMDDVEFAI